MKQSASTNPTGPKQEPKTVEVWCHARGAKEVFLAGDFNHWDPKATRMVRVGENWRAKLSIVPGMYSYNFVIDGKWVCDPRRMAPHAGPPCRILTTRFIG